MNINKIGNIAIIVLIALAVTFSVIGGIAFTKNIGKTEAQVTKEDSEVLLQKQLNKINVTEITPQVGNVADYPSTSEITEDDLPDINKTPLSVIGKGEINLEIFSSPEKAGEKKGEKKDSWLLEVAEDFNRQKLTVNGHTISVSVRNLDSGMGMQYIASGKSVPQLYSPSNEIWGEMLVAKGVKVETVSKRLVGNVAGILLKSEAYEKISEEYGSVNLQSVVNAVTEGKIIMGYTNPTKSSSGLNFIISMLASFDPSNPFSSAAVQKFEQFQVNIPYVTYTTMQLRDKMAEGNDLDACIIEYQSWANMSDLQNCKFIPYGVRHDEPLYAIGNLTQDEQEAAKMFAEYCNTSEAQDLATRYGFNGEERYICEIPIFSGKDYINAQKLFKENKNPGKSIVAVFVADVSGSMDSGGRIENLKKSLLYSFGSIDSSNSIGLVSYSSDVYINLPIGKFDMTQKAKFVGAIEGLTTGGQTATYDAVLVAADMLLKEQEKNPNVKLKMFVLSDGETNCGISYNKMSEIMSGFGIQVYPIGYEISNNELKNMAELNEGAFIQADPEDVAYQIKQLFNAEM